LHIVDLGGNAIDTTSAAGRFMLVILAGAAEMERNLVRERTKAAMGVKRANGERVGTLPYGFTLAADGTTLIPNDAEQETIGAIRTMRAEGLSFTKIAKTLTAQGIPTKSGNGTWNQSSVRGIFKRQSDMEQKA
ncbi:MAG: recombinase family protein, partial [Planctomycetes bacterium]|nr:recombinase family protein [Planctomycetota bacterium]